MKINIIFDFTETELDLLDDAIGKNNKYPNGLIDYLNYIMDNLLNREKMHQAMVFENPLINQENFGILDRKTNCELKPQLKMQVTFNNPRLMNNVFSKKYLNDLKHTGYWTLDHIINYVLGKIMFTNSKTIEIPFSNFEKGQLSLHLSRYELQYIANRGNN